MSDKKKTSRKKYSLDIHYQIGPRVIKTVIAAMICIFYSFLAHDGGTIQVAAVTAIIALQPTKEKTLNIALYRSIGTIIGGIFGVLTLVLCEKVFHLPRMLYVLIIPVGILMMLYLCNLIRITDAASITCIVYIWVVCLFDLQFAEALTMAVYRIVDTLVGVGVSTILNVVFPPKNLIEVDENEEKQDKD